MKSERLFSGTQRPGSLGRNGSVPWAEVLLGPSYMGAHRRSEAVSPCSMSVPQAMEWLIEHAEDPTIDTPLPGPASQGEAGAEAAPDAGTSEEEEARDELTEVFKKIRRKREFRPDARVRVDGHWFGGWRGGLTGGGLVLLR